MSYVYYNPNPNSKSVGDCVVRAIAKATGRSWDQAYLELCIQGFLMKDFGDSNQVWDSYLRGCGFKRRIISNTCPNCYTIMDFCYDHPFGIYVLATGNHVVAVIDGEYYDSWDSGNEIPIYYYTK